MATADRKLDGVFEGGGIKGVGLVGAISVIEEAGYTFENLAGTSAGAIVATLLAAGYHAAELKAILMELDFKRMMDGALFGGVPVLGGIFEAFNLLTRLGVYDGDYFLRFMREKLTAKGIHTFADLQMPHYDDDRYRFNTTAAVHVIDG